MTAPAALVLMPDPPVSLPAVPAAYCPTCLAPLPGWLAGCNKPDCRAADLDYDRTIERSYDQ